ncbi:oligosaccharide flippase family protein [Candidatus Daviesbacteria bacterium]|nr:oligosaccharide flippase family protein [Candidatus Daviesbacteria bacterium]
MKSIKDAIRRPFFYGSATMIIGSNASNFLNYIYHLIMGRLLGPASYGELATLLSLSGLLVIIPASFSLVITKYISSAHTNKDVESIIKWFDKKVFLAGGITFLLIFLTSRYISSFLSIGDHLLITIIGAGFVFTLPLILNRSVLQGLLRFKQMVIIILVESGLKLLLGAVLVYIGFSVGGALVGLIIAGFVGWLLSRWFISDYIRGGEAKSPILKPFVMYSISVLIYSIAMTSLYSTDLILAKHFLSSHDAGIYAALSTLGKIIFFGAGPIGAVMFPLVAQKQKKGENYTTVFKYSFILTSIFALTILAVYWLQPAIAIQILYGSRYLEGVNLLIWFGVFMMFFTLSSLFITYNLSLGRVKVVILPSLAAVAQIGGIWVYHADTMTIVSISILVTALLLATLLIYSSYGKVSYKNKVSFSNRPGI